jgi:formylglycine-generating enzyme required for sulfatase activity
VSRSPRLRLQSLIQAVAVVLLAASTSHAQPAVQWRVEDGGNGHWYLPTTQVFDHFRDASAWAQARGAHLVTLTSSEENAFAANLAPGQFLLGGYQDVTSPSYSEPSGGWRWVTNEPWVFTAWNPGEPQNGSWPDLRGEHYLAWWRFGSPTSPLWNDVGNDMTVPPWNVPWNLPAIVEWDADCNSDGIVDYGQILEGNLADANSNNVPDRCECGAFPTLPSCCPGDLNADRSVDGADLGALLFAWGPAVPQSPADLDGDGQVGGADLGLLLFGWGACPVATPPWATLLEALPDPAVVFDPTLRAAIMATGLAWRVRDSVTGIELLLIPPGTFEMGCASGSYCGNNPLDPGTPVHAVTLTDAYYLGRYEVTQGQWTAAIGSNPSWFTTPSQEVPAADVPERPVERVSWAMIQPFLLASGMRLPTEAEWEYACRAGTVMAIHGTYVRPQGSDFDLPHIRSIAWFGGVFPWGNSGMQTRPVGQLLSNGFGLHDMQGNVLEWTNDWYAPYSADQQVDPLGPASGEFKVVRGGQWYDNDGLPASQRWQLSPTSTFEGIPGLVGFRVARNP